MKRTNAKLGWLIAAMSYVLVGGGTAMADDIELFIAGEDNSGVNTNARPNIMFIIDTSGSMTSDVVTQQDWDPNLTFSGCYRSDEIYWSTTAQQPGCGSNRRFNKTRNFCESSKAMLRGLGEYSGSLLAWRQRWQASRSRWVALSSRNRNRNVECVADAGTHGQNTGAFWAADGSAGPWAGNDANEPAWVDNYTLFDGNYLNWLQSGGTVTKDRIDIVKEVTNNLLDNLQDVNVGLMRFNNQDGGPVIHAMENIETAREEMKDTVDDLPASGWTPLSETLYEAGQYFAGRDVVYGDGFTVDSVPESRVGGTASSGVYNSPIDFACQKNYIVLLTDGAPTQDTGAENRIEGLPGFATATGSNQCSALPNEGNNGKCLDEMAGYLRNHDLSTDFYGDQNVTTYTIGFTVDLPLLSETAAKGGGGYYLADDTTTLTSALTKIVVSILDDASTFSAPSVPVNAFNRTQNLDDIFISVFNPSSTLHWPGNLKKYKLVRGEFFDANLQNAIDSETGFFAEDSQSFWSTSPDGDRPAAGGAAEQLPDFATRNLYTNVAGGDLNLPANSVDINNTALTEEVLGIDGALPMDFDLANTVIANMTDRERLINWMRGMDIFDADDDGDDMDTRRQMGDPLHVRPVPVIYGGTAEDPDMVIFIATNNGYVHAIDPDTGEELWAFVPKSMLGLQPALYEDPVSPLRQYGIDGEIATVIMNDDGIGGISGSERAILTFGMRRGGDSVFALDVTNRNDPQLLWEIDSSTPGFDDLGQTWSTPQPARVKIGGSERDVVFFGGGYDTGQDNESWREDTVGNAIYMVDVATGALLWSAGDGNSYDLDLDEMKHSIPAPLLVASLNGDGLASRLYFGDMGGRIWRIDLINGNNAGNFAEGGVLASVGGAALASPTKADLRRFYNQVDVANVVKNGERFFSINVGSGYRAHPLDRDINEQFFAIRDFKVNGVIATEDYPAPVLFDELVDITGLSEINISSTSRGWRMTMDEAAGEKVLGRSVTFDGTIFFASFSPGSGANACTAVAGQNRLYAISLFNGITILDVPYIQLQQGGIAPQPELVYVPSDGMQEEKLAVLLGPESVEAPSPDPINRTYWTQDGAQ